MMNNQRQEQEPAQPPRTPEDTDALLSRELLALSVQERTQALNEIHGVEDIPLHENLHIINEALQLLHIAISQLLIRDSDSTTSNTDHAHNNPQDFSSSSSSSSNDNSNNNKPTYAYRLALNQNQSYVESRFLRLAFLRAENLGNSGFGGWEKELQLKEKQSKKIGQNNNENLMMIIPSSILKTADRIMNFFTLKLKLWGIDLLTRNITLDDMNDGDKHCLYKGYMTLLPERDRAGRAVVVCLASLIVGCTAQNVNRSFYYVLQCALEDIETQRKGVVCIGYNIDRQSLSWSKDIEKIESEALEVNSRIMQYFYFRMTAMQIVYNDPRLRLLMGFVVYWIGQRIRARFRAHFSAGHIEGQYTLMTFGIPTYCLPIDSSGVFNLYYHLEWLQKRQIQEQQQQQQQQQQVQAQAQQMLSSVQQHQHQQKEQVSSSPLELQFPSSSPKIPSKEETSSMVCNGTATTGITSNGSINGGYNALGSSATAIQNGISTTHRNYITSNHNDINSNGNTSNDKHQKDDDSSEEKRKRRKTVFQVPGPDDVLVGRGKLSNRHIGNKKYNQLVEQYFDQYNASSRFEKTIVAEIIVKTIQENYNGKFLKLGDEGWIEIDDSDARSKVAHTFRNFRRKPTNKKGGGDKKDTGCVTSNTNKSTLTNGTSTSTATKKNISNIKNGGRAKVSPKQQQQQQQQQLSSRLLTLPPVPSSGEEVEGVGGGGTNPVAPSLLPPMDPLSATFFSCLGNNSSSSSNNDNDNDGCTPTGCLPAVCLTGYDIGSVGGTWMDGTRQPRMM